MNWLRVFRIDCTADADGDGAQLSSALVIGLLALILCWQFAK